MVLYGVASAYEEHEELSEDPVSKEAQAGQREGANLSLVFAGIFRIEGWLFVELLAPQEKLA